jgi:hypothetical protein
MIEIFYSENLDLIEHKMYEWTDERYRLTWASGLYKCERNNCLFLEPKIFQSSPPVLCGVRVTRSLILYVCFVDRCLSFCTFFLWSLCCLFFFDLRILITPLWYLQTQPTISHNKQWLSHFLWQLLYYILKFDFCKGVFCHHSIAFIFGLHFFQPDLT